MFGPGEKYKENVLTLENKLISMHLERERERLGRPLLEEDELSQFYIHTLKITVINTTLTLNPTYLSTSQRATQPKVQCTIRHSCSNSCTSIADYYCSNYSTLSSSYQPGDSLSVAITIFRLQQVEMASNIGQIVDLMGGISIADRVEPTEIVKQNIDQLIRNAEETVEQARQAQRDIASNPSSDTQTTAALSTLRIKTKISHALSIVSILHWKNILGPTLSL